MRYLILFLLCSISLLAKETTTYYQDVINPNYIYNITNPAFLHSVGYQDHTKYK